ncbi:hypothetical protein [Ferrimicrobium sp.]|uniref:hypothetical protein n=1 Tax=Ferrimicrobium sp. TaxID=2926050 RepID=UPI00262192F6|nr:hypothetical protein [Ferrimicrobium sp.]
MVFVSWISGMVMVGLAVAVILGIDNRRKRTSYAQVLREYPPAQQRRWRKTVKQLHRQGVLDAAPLPQPGLTIDEVPTTFLLAEKMRLESLRRMQPVMMVVLGVEMLGLMLVVSGSNGDRTLAIVGPLMGLSFSCLWALWRWHQLRRTSPGVARGRVPRLIRSYEYALALRNR